MQFLTVLECGLTSNGQPEGSHPLEARLQLMAAHEDNCRTTHGVMTAALLLLRKMYAVQFIMQQIIAYYI